MTLSLILRFNLRLGATAYGARVLRAPYMIRILGLEHLTASEQPEVLDISEGRSRSNKEGCFGYLKYSKTPSQVLDDCRTRLRRAQGLVRPGAAGLLIGIECSRVRDSLWTYLTSFVTTRIGVELAAVQRKLPDYVVSRIPTVLS